MKIKTHQSGGSFVSVFKAPHYAPTTQKQSTSSSSKSSDDVDYLQKQIVEAVKGSGLQNDVDYLISTAEGFLSDVANQPLPFQNTESPYSMGNLLQLTRIANMVNRNKSIYDAASKNISDQNAYGEIALSDNGRAYAIQGEKLVTIDLSEMNNTDDNTRVLTNAELIHLREQMPELTGNERVLNDMANTIGFESTVKGIQTMISSFGTNSSSASSSQFATNNNNKMMQGIEAILNGDGGLYVQTDSTVKNQNQGYDPKVQDSVDYALSHIWSSLSVAQKNTIRANVAQNGGNPSDTKDVFSLLTSSLQQYTNHTYEVDNKTSVKTYEADGLGGGSGSSSLVQDSVLETVVYGRNAPYGEIRISNEDVGEHNGQAGALVVSGQIVPYQTREGDPIGPTSLQNALLDSQIGIAVNQGSIYLGDQKLNQEAFKQVLVTNDQQMTRVIMPKDKNAEAHGLQKPDLDVYRRFQEFYDFIDDYGDGLTQSMILTKMKEKQLDLVYNPKDGSWNFKPEDCGLFLTLSASIPGKLADNSGVVKESPWLKRNGKKSEWYENIIQTVNDNDESKIGGYRGWNSWFHASRADLYDGILWMPVTSPEVASMSTNPDWGVKRIHQGQRSQQQMKTTWDN